MGLLLRSRYKMSGAHIASEAFDTEFVVLDMATGKYFSLAGGAATAWQAVALTGCDPVALSEALMAGSGDSNAFDTCISAFLSEGLLIPDTVAPADIGDWAQKLLATHVEYRFEVFDDLAALLVADPVHDVEPEAGWPHPLPAQ